MRREPWHLEVDGVAVAGVLTWPEGPSRPWPVVFTAPGFAGVKEMLIPDYSLALGEAGVASFAFDYPNFGESGGEPRQHVDPAQQLRSFRVALDRLAGDPRFDPTRIGVWGTSLSGGHALMMGDDRRIAAVAAIIPFIKVEAPAPAPAVIDLLMLDAARHAAGEGRVTMPVAGRPGELAVMNSDGAFEWSLGMAAGAANYRNEVTVASLPNMAAWSTMEGAHRITAPLFVVLAESDSITPPHLVRHALQGIEATYQTYPETHFELFGKYGADVRAKTVAWLAGRLAAA